MSTRYAFNKSVRELRFLFCNTSAHSDATRAFLKRAYPTMKKNNPYIPIMMREALDTEPRVFARYEMGVEKQEPLLGMHILSDSRGLLYRLNLRNLGLTDKEIEEKVTALVRGSI
ncbi:hypothetical protein ACO22_00155 [Paracoccidioides brasiliensis]|uniref:Ribosomal protein/NADH dehydrogenase domain-containing protein n=1 Tax=Paracoccidioides brasiliensis TaxID=121759 RepID=A0A1D2JQG7_PARBR|nr:hypothetical protein ACO22_00155 [Paracoccidioides brasiliensis]